GRGAGAAARLLNLWLPWGGSSAGRASRSQCEGREFDPPPLHHPTSPARARAAPGTSKSPRESTLWVFFLVLAGPKRRRSVRESGTHRLEGGQRAKAAFRLR